MAAAPSRAKTSRFIAVTIESNLPVMMVVGMYSWNRSCGSLKTSSRNGSATWALAK